MQSIILALTVLVSLVLSGPVTAQSVRPVFSQAIPNVPGKSLITVEVTYAPGEKSNPHRHARSAFIHGYVISGTIRTQVEGKPVQTLKAGESFYELPGDHHILGENASQIEPASFLAVFVVDTDDKVLTTPDK